MEAAALQIEHLYVRHKFNRDTETRRSSDIADVGIGGTNELSHEHKQSAEWRAPHSRFPTTYHPLLLYDSQFL
ncbi:unnamed protein product [Caenorhabditis auriculariae]|uniref:Uncharacterized protein n=1 Tax=Caenorhabditis auriculariae TaxID=2777116 RepID=A0A8S1GNE2_9PELO|nr:unnamed protein product [Caenorhabditis auriculariae]